MFQHMMHYTARRSNVALYGSPSALDVSVKCFGNVSTHDALYGSPRPSALRSQHWPLPMSHPSIYAGYVFF